MVNKQKEFKGMPDRTELGKAAGNEVERESMMGNHSCCRGECTRLSKMLKIRLRDIFIDHRENDSHYSVYLPDPYGYQGTTSACCKYDAIRYFLQKNRQAKRDKEGRRGDV